MDPSDVEEKHSKEGVETTNWVLRKVDTEKGIPNRKDTETYFQRKGEVKVREIFSVEADKGFIDFRH